MYENLSFLQKRWLSITKSQNRGTQKYPKIPRNLFGRSAQSAKLFGMFKKNLSWGSESVVRDFGQCLIYYGRKSAR